ncbi:hypothetical protein PQX77_000962 [Marasmius sp. AFHP31]|nr:hypothetical protein PQX77_000962 [Marasmius sp. AFHP31]
MLDLVRIFIIIASIAGGCFLVFVVINFIVFLRTRPGRRVSQPSAEEAGERSDKVAELKDMSSTTSLTTTPVVGDSTGERRVPCALLDAAGVGTGVFTGPSVVRVPLPIHHDSTYKQPREWDPYSIYNSRPVLQQPVYHQR